MNMTLGLAVSFWLAATPDAVDRNVDSRPEDWLSAPTVVERFAPDFPRLLLQGRISATVSVDVRVSHDGCPVSAKGTVTSSVMPSLSRGLSAMFEEAAEVAALKWRFASVAPDAAERVATITFVFTAKKNDGPVENSEQQAQRDVVIEGPLSLEVIEAPYVCYTPSETVVK